MVLYYKTNFCEVLFLCAKTGVFHTRANRPEKDPTADVEGIDACRKICIISSLVFGKHVYPQDVYTKGISDIELEDV